MSDDLASAHPFCRKELMTDGKTVFMRNAASDDPRFLDVLTRQGAFSDVILPVLKALDYDKIKMLAKRWHITKSVVIDPQICFGSPVVESVGIPASILAKAYVANGEDAEAVADWYGVDRGAVLAAAEFERQFAA